MPVAPHTTCTKADMDALATLANEVLAPARAYEFGDVFSAGTLRALEDQGKNANGDKWLTEINRIRSDAFAIIYGNPEDQGGSYGDIEKACCSGPWQLHRPAPEQATLVSLGITDEAYFLASNYVQGMVVYRKQSKLWALSATAQLWIYARLVATPAMGENDQSFTIDLTANRASTMSGTITLRIFTGGIDPPGSWEDYIDFTGDVGTVTSEIYDWAQIFVTITYTGYSLAANTQFSVSGALLDPSFTFISLQNLLYAWTIFDTASEVPAISDTPCYRVSGSWMEGSAELEYRITSSQTLSAEYYAVPKNVAEVEWFLTAKTWPVRCVSYSQHRKILAPGALQPLSESIPASKHCSYGLRPPLLMQPSSGTEIIPQTADTSLPRQLVKGAASDFATVDIYPQIDFWGAARRDGFADQHHPDLNKSGSYRTCAAISDIHIGCWRSGTFSNQGASLAIATNRGGVIVLLGADDRIPIFANKPVGYTQSGSAYATAACIHHIAHFDEGAGFFSGSILWSWPAAYVNLLEYAPATATLYNDTEALVKALITSASETVKTDSETITTDL